MKLSLIKNQYNNLEALTSVDFAKISKLQNGQVLEVDYKKVNNSDFHRKLMKLFAKGWENSNKLPNVSYDTYRKFITCLAGYGKIIETELGLIPEAESLKFSEMDHDKRESLYNDVLQVIIVDLKLTEENLLSEMGGFI